MELLGKPLHVGISVYDMEESLAWYRDVLGFTLVKDDGYIPPLKAHVVFIERDGFQLELFRYDAPIPLPEARRTPNSDLQTVGTKHVAFAVADMAAMKAHLLEKGADIAHEVNMGADHVLFIRDCNGVLIELIAAKE